QGSRLYLSERQVYRYASDPIRLQKRAQALQQSPKDPKTQRPGSELPSESELWRESHHLTPQDSHAKTWLQKDFGEYYTTRQVARELGIAPTTVDKLRL